MKEQFSILSFLKIDPKFKKYKKEISEDLKNQINLITKPISIISFFAWLVFAFDTDPKIHPEFPELLFFRLGLSLVSLIAFICTYINSLKPIQHYISQSISIYAMLSCSIFTGRLADDANYMSGYLLLILIVSILPSRLSVLFSLYLASILIFIIAIFIYNPILNTKTAQYSLNNLLIAYTIAPVIAILLKNFRIKLFINHLEVNSLKLKQDGDYFLTLLLLEPFLKERQSVNFCKIQTYIEQNKKFQFKNSSYEIGGDSILIEKIILNEKEYLLIVNADAMGKSIQGAGGSIVFNVVIEGLIDKTRKLRINEVKWLTLCYKELQRSFEKFKGSMLVSAVVGVINEEGDFYFFNAEHPYPCLLRNRKANFLGIKNIHYKLGTEIEEKDSKVKINRVKLQKGDIVFIGSDGKDDFEIPSLTENSLPEINYNEKIFLHNLEKANGEFYRILKYINQNGKITDDLSLIKIEYLNRE